ncbi:MAG: 2Fe-2S iron-sulfur cluster-binding protein [Pseudomonadota bacterium]
MRIIVTDREGTVQEADGDPGLKLMESIRDLDNSVDAICGGLCSCATCHVYVGDEWLGKLPAIADDEEELLDSLEHRQANSRLSCQIELTPELDGITLTVGPEE